MKSLKFDVKDPADHMYLLSVSEFQPGVPWKGVQSPEPEPDPYMTPAGMMGSAVLADTEHHLLQDNTGAESERVRLKLASSSDAHSCVVLHQCRIYHV